MIRTRRRGEADGECSSTCVADFFYNPFLPPCPFRRSPAPFHSPALGMQIHGMIFDMDASLNEVGQSQRHTNQGIYILCQAVNELMVGHNFRAKTELLEYTRNPIWKTQQSQQVRHDRRSRGRNSGAAGSGDPSDGVLMKHAGVSRTSFGTSASQRRACASNACSRCGLRPTRPSFSSPQATSSCCTVESAVRRRPFVLSLFSAVFLPSHPTPSPFPLPLVLQQGWGSLLKDGSDATVQPFLLSSTSLREVEGQGKVTGFAALTSSEDFDSAPSPAAAPPPAQEAATSNGRGSFFRRAW